MTIRTKLTWSTATAAVLALLAVPALAKVPAQEAAQLASTLTPVGAVKAANQDGSIPAWTGGITQAEVF